MKTQNRSSTRKTTRNKISYYSVIDAITGVVDTKNPRDYWYHVKNRPMGADRLQLSTLCRQLRLRGPDGKFYLTDCADRKGMSLIFRTLPSKSAAPILRRNRYNIETVEKALTGKSEHICKNLIGSCRHAAAENQQSLRRETPSTVKARKKAQPKKSVYLLSDDLLDQLDRTLFPFLKALYPQS